MAPDRNIDDQAVLDLTLVEVFVSRHFSIQGSLKLHRHSLGWDLVRSPANVALAPIYLATRLAALMLSFAGFRLVGSWLADQRILFRSAVARAVETAVRTEVIEERGKSFGEPTRRQTRLIEEYSDVRSAVSEICTTILVLLLGAILFQTATPGVISLAPIVSDYTATSTAYASFPFGQRLGSLWYGVFPVELPLWYVITVGFVLAAVASGVTSFAGVVADPLQVWCGLHRRRLHRLLATLDAEVDAPPELAREHVVARLADFTDAGLSLLRALRS